MSKEIIDTELAAQIADLYTRMEEAYAKVAGELNFSCQGCPDNCCDSFFLHHTYLEWGYLRVGLEALPAEKRREIEERAQQYILEGEKSMALGQRPQVMCPLNDNGRCSLYEHRLMICRMHGVPSSMTRPDGQSMDFPGCFRCQEIVGAETDGPCVDRTAFYQELVQLESAFLGPKRHALPKLKMTIAQMIIKDMPAPL